MRRFPIALIFVVLGFASQTHYAQDSANTCSALLTTAISQVGNNCADLTGNHVCYGYPDVQATFDEDTASAPSFSKPADQVELTDLNTLETSPLNLSDGTWGIAAMDVQADLPVALPGLVFLTFGAVEVENEVDPATALVLPAEALSVNVAADTNLLDAPDAASDIVGAVSAGAVLSVDGITPDGQWLRAYFEHEREYSRSAVAWVSTTDLVASADIITLPVIASDSQTPMQILTLRNGYAEPECSDAPPSLLYIQGPEGIEANIRVNDADIRLSSAITLRLRPGSSLMQLVALSGLITLGPNSTNPLIVPPGFASDICLGEDGRVGPDCSWSTPYELTQSELRQLAMLELIPINILRYRFRHPIIVCPSGVGRPGCYVFLPHLPDFDRIRGLCERGRLPQFICRALIR